MILGISMSPKNWALALTAVALALVIPFALGAQLATMALPVLAEPIRFVVGYVAMPFVLCYLYDRGKLHSEPASIFFYIYKCTYLAVGIAAVAIALLSGTGFEGGILLFGLVMTIFGLVLFWQSWKVDKRNQHIADRLLYGPEEPLDRKTIAILDAAQARALKTADKPMLLTDLARS